MQASPKYPCSLYVKIGIFPEDIVFKSILSPNNLQPVDLASSRLSLLKIVITKTLDRVGDQFILSRAIFSAPSCEGEGRADGWNGQAGNNIDWRAIDRLIAANPKADFVELVRAIDVDPATDFVKSDLRFVDFGRCNLTGFNFEGSNLHGADLSQVAVENANFCDTKGCHSWAPRKNGRI